MRNLDNKQNNIILGKFYDENIIIKLDSLGREVQSMFNVDMDEELPKDKWREVNADLKSAYDHTCDQWVCLPCNFGFCEQNHSAYLDHRTIRENI